MPTDEERDDLVESIKILATDDERLKSFGQLFANDLARKILQLLFNEELTAARISQRTDTSLQLVKYHLQKLQELGVVKISKTSKNSKSHDMKHYTAKSFSVVVVPPKLSEKTKSSRLLIHSFRHIYKVAGLAVATGISGMFSALQLQQGSRFIQDSASTASPVSDVGREGVVEGGGETALQATTTTTTTTPQDAQQQDTSQKESQQQDVSTEESVSQHDAPQVVQDESMAEMGDALQEQAMTADMSEEESVTVDDSAAVEVKSADLDSEPSNALDPAPPPEPAELSPSLETQDGPSDDGPGVTELLSDADVSSSSATLFQSSGPFPELFLPLVAVTVVLGGLTIFYLVKYLKRS